MSLTELPSRSWSRGAELAVADSQQLVDLLARLSYREGNFPLSSGAVSSFYLDAKQVTYSPEGVVLVGRAILDLIMPFNVEAIGGLTMGADAIVTSTVRASVGSHTPIPGFVVRKAPKPHGLQKQIEGVSPKDRRVAIVDDVITSGSSVLRAVEQARAAHADVALVVCLVDREEGGRSAVEAEGLAFKSICTLTQVRNAFERMGSGMTAP